MTAAMRDVLAERQRQIEDEGWSVEHDDSQTRGELAQAAACYAAGESIYRVHLQRGGRDYSGIPVISDVWPFDETWWKPKDRRRDLVRAAALIIAEIERLDRRAEADREMSS